MRGSWESGNLESGSCSAVALATTGGHAISQGLGFPQGKEVSPEMLQ